MSDSRLNLALGTVQLGQAYGIANRSGKPDRAEAFRLLEAAVASGIRIFDTSQHYGDSEAVIGSFLASGGYDDIQVITKLDPALNVFDADAVLASVSASVARIGRRPTGLLLHNMRCLGAWDGQVGRNMFAIKAEGLVESLGVSVYTPDEFSQALDAPDIEIIQAPYNVFDHSLLDLGLLDRAMAAGKRIFLRSIFLQGLLLLEPDQLLQRMLFAKKYLEPWRELCRRHELDPFDAALRFVLGTAGQATVLIGCETLDQLQANVAVANSPDLPPELLAEILALPQGEEMLVNPALWPREAA